MTVSLSKLSARQGATTVTCSTEFEWMNNAKAQEPCLVASWSVEPCRSHSWRILPITPNGPYPARYTGPQSDSDLYNCQCNTVHYSLIAALSQVACSFTQFLVHCPASSIRGPVYPVSIPPETDFPAWAYLSLLDDQWDAKAARSLVLQNQASPDTPSSAASSSSTVDRKTVLSSFASSTSSTSVI
ncbi:hypothetical protein C8Q76DRAFT_783847, partial [Earliella scabrosa]